MGLHDIVWHNQHIAFWIVLLVLAVLVSLSLWRTRQSNGNSGRGSAEDIVKRRYASGEIDRETYERMISDLRR